MSIATAKYGLTSSVADVLRLSRFRNAYVRRGLLVWGALRAVSAFFIVGLRSAGVVPPEGPLLGSIGQLVLLAITALVLYLDARRRREVAFLGNLGIAAPAPAIVGLALPLLVEAVIS